jgi:hypothetical protein
MRVPAGGGFGVWCGFFFDAELLARWVLECAAWWLEPVGVALVVVAVLLALVCCELVVCCDEWPFPDVLCCREPPVLGPVAPEPCLLPGPLVPPVGDELWWVLLPPGCPGLPPVGTVPTVMSTGSEAPPESFAPLTVTTAAQVPGTEYECVADGPTARAPS